MINSQLAPIPSLALVSISSSSSACINDERNASCSSGSQLENPPSDLDVLLGRGGKTNMHRGNVQFRRDKEQLQPFYLATSSKVKKTSIAQRLVDTVYARGGRFLKPSADGKSWDVATNAEARKKASQLLRENFTKEQRKAKRVKYANKKMHTQDRIPREISLSQEDNMSVLSAPQQASDEFIPVLSAPQPTPISILSDDEEIAIASNLAKDGDLVDGLLPYDTMLRYFMDEKDTIVTEEQDTFMGDQNSLLGEQDSCRIDQDSFLEDQDIFIHQMTDFEEI